VRRVRLDAETSSLRAALFSSVTHDLRTPLASIKASATGLIAEGTEYTDAQRREMAQTVIEEADHLNQIVGNLLDLARMRAGALIPAKQTVFLEDVIASVLRRMHRTLEGFDVRTNIRPHLSPIAADPVQIEQVLSNLLENATRFSPKGSEITVSATEWNGMVQAKVADHGTGIPEVDRNKVFDEFFSRDSGRGRGGTGLGLAISRAIVLGHGGRISAEAAPGGGTAIVIEIPVAKDPVDAPLPRRVAHT
jgi:two-component system sensor histidine kinase KdpD